jgi:hypothetical protein
MLNYDILILTMKFVTTNKIILAIIIFNNYIIFICLKTIIGILFEKQIGSMDNFRNASF